MNAYLKSISHTNNRAIRSANYCHRYSSDNPFMIVLMTQGGDPFSVSAIAYGQSPNDFNLIVAGDSRIYPLQLNLLVQFADAFNNYVESCVNQDVTPQIVLLNRASLEVLWQISRGFAYKEEQVPDEIICMARYLQIFIRREPFPGQQLIIVLTDFLNAHWVIELSIEDAEALPILDAYIEPSHPNGGFATMEAMERDGTNFIGPHTTNREDKPLMPLLESFKQQRGNITDTTSLAPMQKPIKGHYKPLLRRGWELGWRCLEREKAYEQAECVDRRWQDDGHYFQKEIQYIMGGGRYLSSPTDKSTCRELYNCEQSLARLTAEEAIADPLRLYPYLLKHEAVVGKVVWLDLDYREMINGKNQRQPLLILEANYLCLIPEGMELWWTGLPRNKAWELREIEVNQELSFSRLTLIHRSNRLNTPRPSLGDLASFSVFNLDSAGYTKPLPEQVPWTHQSA